MHLIPRLTHFEELLRKETFIRRLAWTYNFSVCELILFRERSMSDLLISVAKPNPGDVSRATNVKLRNTWLANTRAIDYTGPNGDY